VRAVIALFLDARLNDRHGDLLLASVLAIVTCVPLAWRRRAPVVVLLLVAAGLLACLAAFRPTVAAIPVAMLALYTSVSSETGVARWWSGPAAPCSWCSSSPRSRQRRGDRWRVAADAGSERPRDRDTMRSRQRAACRGC